MSGAYFVVLTTLNDATVPEGFTVRQRRQCRHVCHTGEAHAKTGGVPPQPFLFFERVLPSNLESDLRTFFRRFLPAPSVQLLENLQRRPKVLTEKTSRVLKIRQATFNYYRSVDKYGASKSTVHVAVNHVLAVLS